MAIRIFANKTSEEKHFTFKAKRYTLPAGHCLAFMENGKQITLQQAKAVNADVIIIYVK